MVDGRAERVACGARILGLCADVVDHRLDEHCDCPLARCVHCADGGCAAFWRSTVVGQRRLWACRVALRRVDAAPIALCDRVWGRARMDAAPWFGGDGDMIPPFGCVRRGHVWWM